MKTERPGVALIAVIMLLAGLAAVGAPFMMSSALENRESRLFAARARARTAAEGALARALWCLSRTSEVVERRNLEDEQRTGVAYAPFDTPDWDTLDELAVNFDFAPPALLKGQKPQKWPPGLAPGLFRDARGEIWKAEVEDEQGKINVNSATPALAGNLLGSAVLMLPLAAGDGGMELSSTWAFDADADGNTVDGFVRVDREIIAYRSKTGESLDGLVRGCFGSEVENHGAGALVYDARGWAIAAYKVYRANGTGPLARFQSVAAIDKIAEIQTTVGRQACSLGLEPAKLEAVERCLTAGSFRAKADGWVRREGVLNRLFEADQRTFRLRDNANFGPGTMVRFTDDLDKVLAYGRIRSAQYRPQPGPNGANVTLESDVGFRSDGLRDVFMEAELPHAINVNTARVPVLAACMTGLALQNNPGIAPERAWLVAERLASGVIRNQEDLDAAVTAARDQGLIDDPARQAILENATVPGSTRLRVTTAPFCFRAYSLFTVEASAAVNSPTSGRMLAVHTIRELVQMPTGLTGLFLVRSQKEFEEQMKVGFGRKVVTWPNAIIDRNNVPDESVADDVGDVRLGTGWASGKPQGFRLVEHFDRRWPGTTLTPDGVRLNGQPLPFAGAFTVKDGSVTPGSAEAWFKARDWTGSLFWSIRDPALRACDLLDVSYDPAQGELVMELGDGTLDGKTIQYRQPYNLGANTWYHVKAAYKSTRLGGQAFQVDGGMLLPVGAARYSPMTKLGEDLDAGVNWPLGVARNVAVEDASLFPDSGAFIIDSEIFEYTARDATTFQNVTRGKRYTQPAAHTHGAAVQIWGYSARLPGGTVVPRVSGLVAEDIGANPNTTINKPGKPPPPPDPGGIDDKVTVIPVVSTAGFQSAGYLWCDQECIYYGAKTPTEFQSCERGVLGPPAAAHPHGRRITQVSLMVTNYDNYPNSGTVQIDEAGSATRVEWLDYSQKRVKDDRFYLMPTFSQDSGGNWYVSSFRGTYGTGGRAHAKSAKVIPVFDLAGPECGDANSPQFEPVTIVNPDNSRELRRIKRAYESTSFWRDVNTGAQGWAHTFRAAFEDFVSRDYRGARLLKFPSGELALQLNTLEVGRGLAGELDEVRLSAAQSQAGFLPADLWLKSTDAGVVVQMPSDAAAGLVPSEGLASLGDELVYYRGRSVGRRTLPFSPKVPFRNQPPQYDTHDVPVVTLSNVRRAVLGTNGADHAPGTAAAFLETMPVTELTGVITPSTTVAQLRNTTGFDDEGYALVGSEILGYARRQNNALDQTFFHGAYGTPAQSHGPGELVLPLPFRYWDRYLPESDRSELAYFQGCFAAAGTVWQTLELAVRQSAASRLLVLVRFDGAPGWATRPTNREGGIYQFEGPGPHPLRNSAGKPVRADQIEYRVFFLFAEGAAGGTGWKETPAVDTVAVEYGNPLVVLRREVSRR